MSKISKYKSKKKSERVRYGSIELLFAVLWAISPWQNMPAEAAVQKIPVFRMSPSADQSIDSEIIVKYKKDSLSLKSAAGRQKADNLEKSKSFASIDEIKGMNARLLKTDKPVADSIAELEKDPNVEYAESNFKKFPMVTSVNDPLFSQQWDLGKVGAPQYWDSENPSDKDVIVAVLDTGVDYNHEDLAGSMWDGSASCKDENGAAIAGGCPHHGWDFKDYQTIITGAGVDDNDPIGEPRIQNGVDEGSHGTWVSGVIAASANNSKGISGLSYDGHIKIMAVRFGMDTFSELKGINFAKNNGAKIINASFGGNNFSQAEKDAIASFPGLFVAAAGNEAANNETIHTYPSDYMNVNIISVAASDQSDRLTSFSNYGSASVDLAAPGASIVTTDYFSSTSYKSVSGTSFSAPLVSGAVALMESKNLSLTDGQIKNAITDSGDALAGGDGAKILSGKRLNLSSAYLAVESTVPTPGSTPNPQTGAAMEILSANASAITKTKELVSVSSNNPSLVTISIATKLTKGKLSGAKNKSDGVENTTHTVSLSGLKRNKTYYYQITVKSPDGTQTAKTAIKKFRTKK